mmetsp:Transcript_37389/g.79327  ORF Transcript_37389/g.79327 Transcript_37389/m.79327 type:complete len:612 (-) Transcript_37389:615-2450(-)
MTAEVEVAPLVDTFDAPPPGLPDPSMEGARDALGLEPPLPGSPDTSLDGVPASFAFLSEDVNPWLPVCPNPWAWQDPLPNFPAGGGDPNGFPVGPPLDAINTGTGLGLPPANGIWDIRAQAGAFRGPTWPILSPAETLQKVREAVSMMEMDNMNMKVEYFLERKNLMQQVGHCKALLSRYCIPLDEAVPENEYYEETGNCYAGGMEANNWEGQNDPSAPPGFSGKGDRLNEERPNRHDNEGPIGGGSVTSVLRSMFPHAKVRNIGPEEDLEESKGLEATAVVMDFLRRIERTVGSEADGRALRALQGLSESDALEALTKVDDLVDSQGGQCRNLSSILQSVCRKIEKRASRGSDRGLKDDIAAAAAQAEAEVDEVWTPKAVEQVARKNFELRREGAEWRLKIAMSQIQPHFTEAAMRKYCSWLSVRFSAFTQEHADALKTCRGEVDFTHNGMTDSMLRMLLETLARFEVHVAVMRFSDNNITNLGATSICEYLRNNESSDPVWELYLSRNDIEDDGATELMTTLHDLIPRYPPWRPDGEYSEVALAPVWLFLKHNRLSRADSVRYDAEQLGVTICLAKDRIACSPGKCMCEQVPLLHLPGFGTQRSTTHLD